jgi:hypothetical protein
LRRDRSPSTNRQSRSVYKPNSSSGSAPSIDRSRLSFDTPPHSSSLLQWYVNTTGGAKGSLSSASSPISNPSSKRLCTDVYTDKNIINASEESELSNDSFTPVFPTESTRSQSPIKKPHTSVTHVDAVTAKLNNKSIEPTKNTLNATNKNNQLVLASSALAIPSVIPIGQHVVEWVSLKRDNTRIVAQRTFGCQTSPSLETLKLD